MNLPNTPRDQEERRLRGGTITERASNPEDRRHLPHLAIITPTERASCAEDLRLALGLR